MDIATLLQQELRGSVNFFLDYTNLRPGSPGFGLAVDTTQNARASSIAAVGFALTAWVIAAERGYLSRDRAAEITRGTFRTLRDRAAHHRGFFAHFLEMDTAARLGRCEYSTIDTALCLNGVITAAAYFADAEIQQLARDLLERVDWNFIIFETEGRPLFRMAYNPDRQGDYVTGEPGYIHQWDMAAEQKMMYLQAAGRVAPAVAVALYRGFPRDVREYAGHQVIVNPGGNLFAYQFSEAWLDAGRYLDPDGLDWFENTRRAILANRQFCLDQAGAHRTYAAHSWGLSAGDSPWGYDVSGSAPSLHPPRHNGTVSIYGALASLPFVPDLTAEMLLHLYRDHPQTWGRYGFFDAYNLDVAPPWYSSALYGIDKGCSMIMIENHLSRLVWDTYTNSPEIQRALAILGFRRREAAPHG